MLEASNAKKRILLAEDEGALRNVLLRMLTDSGYQVEAVANGFEAWELMQKNPYDLVMSDVFMPEVTGIELVRRGQQSYPETKFVLVSGGGREVKAEHGQKRVSFADQEVIVDMYLEKPFKLRQLIQVLDKLL